MKQVWPNYSYSPATNVLTLTGLNIDRDQLLLVAAPERGRIMYNFADSSVTASSFTSGANTSLTLVASTAGLTTTASLVIYYDDQLQGNSVTISSLPAISGTVTANVANSVTIASLPAISGTVTANVFGENVNSGTPIGLPIASGNDNFVEEGPRLGVQLLGNDGLAVGQGSECILPISGTVTVNLNDIFYLPKRIKINPVTFTDENNFNYSLGGIYLLNTESQYIKEQTLEVGSQLVTSSLTLTKPQPTDKNNHRWVFNLSNQDVDYLARLDGKFLPFGTYTDTQGTFDGPFQVIEIPDTFVSGTVTVGNSIIIGNSVTISSLPSISGTVTASVTNSVTVGSFPKVSLIDGSGTISTANSAVQVFATSTTRSYLLIQVTTGSAYVNVGDTATTANGIYFSSGQGYAWETTIPQGAVSLISSVTGTAYCAKQA